MHACRARGNTFAARLVIGFGLMALGVVFILRNLTGHPPASWLCLGPLALLLLALAGFARRGWLSFGGHLMLLAALALELRLTGHLDLLARWWPAALVWIGLVKLAHALRRRGEPVSCQDPCERCS
jgi:hypothetical protein